MKATTACPLPAYASQRMAAPWFTFVAVRPTKAAGSPIPPNAVWSARKQLWIAPVTGATPAHQLTDLRGDNSNPRWSPDGRQIALVSQRGDNSFIAVYDFGRDSV